MNRMILRWLAVALLVLAAEGAFGIDPTDLNRVTFMNSTGNEIIYLFFSPGNSAEWGANVLGTTRTLVSGQGLGFFIHYPENAAGFDFLAIDEHGDAYLIWGYEISDAGPAVVEITLADLEGGYDLPDLATVELRNETGYDVWYVFFSPGDSLTWGIDMLDDETILESGDALSLFVPVGAGPVRYDVLSVDEDLDLYEFTIEISRSNLSYTVPIEPSHLR